MDNEVKGCSRNKKRRHEKKRRSENEDEGGTWE
jgi:hypothetical protein